MTTRNDVVKAINSKSGHADTSVKEVCRCASVNQSAGNTVKYDKSAKKGGK